MLYAHRSLCILYPIMGAYILGVAQRQIGVRADHPNPEGFMSMKKCLLLAALTLGAALPFASNARASSTACEGRESWLVPGTCTYCEWGGSCGACKISGCKPQGRM